MTRHAKLADFSIVIPARNEARNIRLCLDSLLNQDYTGEIEILVIDGLSEDETARIVCEYSERDERVCLYTNPKRITPNAFNIGLKAARGRIVMVVGAHYYVPDSFLSQIADIFSRYPDVDCLGGKIIRFVDTDEGRMIEAVRATLLGGGTAMRTSIEQETVVTRSNIAYIWRRRVIETVGLFDERLVKNQDNEYNLRSIRAGFKTLYAPQLHEYYQAPGTISKMYRQLFGYASYIPLIQLKYRSFLYPHYALPFVALLGWLVLLLLGLPGVLPIWLAPVLLVGYALIVSAAALSIVRKGFPLRLFPRICLTFAAVHLATSLGYLRGMLRLLDLRQAAGLWSDYRRLPVKPAEGLAA